MYDGVFNISLWPSRSPRRARTTVARMHNEWPVEKQGGKRGNVRCSRAANCIDKIRLDPFVCPSTRTPEIAPAGAIMHTRTSSTSKAGDVPGQGSWEYHMQLAQTRKQTNTRTRTRTKNKSRRKIASSACKSDLSQQEFADQLTNARSIQNSTKPIRGHSAPRGCSCKSQFAASDCARSGQFDAKILLTIMSIRQ